MRYLGCYKLVEISYELIASTKRGEGLEVDHTLTPLLGVGIILKERVPT
jgi:hypothetical protein